MTGGDRLIVALDVPSVETAHTVVDELSNVQSYKIGWRLLMAGLRARGLAALWERIAGDGKRIFVDLKVPDIGNTVADVSSLDAGDFSRTRRAPRERNVASDGLT